MRYNVTITIFNKLGFISKLETRICADPAKVKEFAKELVPDIYDKSIWEVAEIQKCPNGWIRLCNNLKTQHRILFNTVETPAKEK